MSPPVTKAAPAAPAQTCNLESIDLTPFKEFPTLDTIHKFKKDDPTIKTFYGIVGLALQIDEKIGGANGTKNGKLDSAEIDAYLKAQPQERELFSTCDFMTQFRMYASQLPELKEEFTSAPDLSDIDVSLFRSLPQLENFPSIEMAELANAEGIVKKIKDSNLPEKFKTLFLANPDLLIQYIVAGSYAKMDANGDGKLSIDDIKSSLAQVGDTQTDPAEYFYQAKMAAIPIATLGFDLREELRLPSDPKLLSLKEIALVVQLVPQFAQANPALSALIAAAFPVGADGQPHAAPVANDGIITLEEFKAAPAVQSYLLTTSKSAEEVFRSLQGIKPALSTPVGVWPDDLKAAYEKMDKSSRDQLEGLMQLPVEQQQIDFVIRMMEGESVSKYKQERDLDHPDHYKGHLVANFLSWAFSLGNVSYGDHFHNKRPQAHKEERDQAINALKTAIRENGFEKIEDAIAYMAVNQSDALDVLNRECDLKKWIPLSKIGDNVERNRQILKLAEEFREGKWGSFWDWQVFPSPSLGKGGWFDRATQASSWSWGKSPQTIMALALNNYIGIETPNNFDAKHLPDMNLLVQQLPEEQRKAFIAIIGRIEKGETVATEEIQKAIAAPSLSAEGQAELLSQVKVALVESQNKKAIEDPAFQAEYKKLDAKQQEKAAQLVGTIAQLFVDPNSPLDPAKMKLAIESLDKTFHKVASKVAEVDVSQEKQLLNGIQEQTFPASFNKVLIDLVGKMKRVEGGAKSATAIDALFREAKFQNVARATQLFMLPKPTEDQMREFKDLVLASQLSPENKAKMLGFFLLQPNTFVAEEAEANFMAILGEPMKDPITGDFSPRYTGNLHSATRATLNKTLFGAGGLAAPTLVSGSFGHALFRSIGNYSAMPLEEINGVRRWVFQGRWLNQLGNSGLFKSRLLRTAAGDINPWAGAVIFGAAGTVFTVSPYADDLRKFSYDALTYPYFPWSDMAVRDMPQEGIRLYLDTCASLQGMDAVLAGAKTIGTLELGTRFANGVRAMKIGNRLANRLEKVAPKAAEWLRGRSGVNSLGLGGVGNAFKSAGNAFLGKTEAQISEELLKGADNAAAQWAADVQGLNTPERIWAKAAHEKAAVELQRVRAHFASTPEGARFAELQDQLANPALTLAERLPLQAELQALAPKLSKTALGRLTQAEMKARSLRVLGKVGQNPEFSKSILKRAQEWIEEGARTGNTELIDRGWSLIEKGAIQHAQLPLLGMQNQKMAKFMLWMLFHEKTDEVVRPKTPVTPSFPEALARGAIIPPPAKKAPPAAKKAP